LLLAAAQQTGLLCELQAAICSPGQEESVSEQPKSSEALMSSQGKLVATLLFLSAVGVHRSWDLRSYSGDALGLLTGRKRAYSYNHTEQFLCALAKTDAAERLTDALGGWTSQLWHSEGNLGEEYYVDGHHKPVYSQHLIPRGLIGRTHQILGCRGLMLLHDSQGHPLLVLTGRGDWHVMKGLAEIVARYEQITAQPIQGPIVVDREGMGAAFLKERADEGHCIVTLLRSNQYSGLCSFSDVEPFVPLTFDSHGTMTREVARARLALALPKPTGAMLWVQVALIRDLRACQSRAGADLQAAEQAPDSRLIPIISTDAGPVDAVALASSYIQRWAAQENVIKDYLLPLGLDTNHGFAKAPVVNSEVAKKRGTSQKHIETYKKWMESAHVKYHQTINSKVKLVERIERDEQQYYTLSTAQDKIDKNSVNYSKQYNKIQKKKDTLSIQQEKRKKRLQKISSRIIDYQEKGKQYEQKQFDLLQSLEGLEKNERVMYELDNRKDHIMTVFKVALANLAMWTRDHYFPDTYAHATWDRLAPFFRLPGIIRSNQHVVSVSLRPFNNQQYNRDLHLLCQLVNQKQLHLPDGRLLQFSLLSSASLILNGQTLLVA